MPVVHLLLLILPLQHKVVLSLLIFSIKNITVKKMTAFVTRSILLFAAKALKYNVVVFATSKL